MCGCKLNWCRTKITKHKKIQFVNIGYTGIIASITCIVYLHLHLYWISNVCILQTVYNISQMDFLFLLVSSVELTFCSMIYMHIVSIVSIIWNIDSEIFSHRTFLQFNMSKTHFIYYSCIKSLLFCQ